MLVALRTILTAFLLLPSVGLSQTKNSGVDADIARYLSATRFAVSFKQGIRSVVASQGHSNDFIDRVLSLPDSKIISAVTPIFQKELSPEEAKEIAVFYSSSAGQAVVNQQFTNLGNPNPPITLSVAQRAQYEKFIASAGGRATKRLDALQHTDAFWHQINQAVAAAAQN